MVRLATEAGKMTKDINTTKTTGSCLCNAVTYELTGKAHMKILCHCSMCKKATGSCFMANWWYAKDVGYFPFYSIKLHRRESYHLNTDSTPKYMSDDCF